MSARLRSSLTLTVGIALLAGCSPAAESDPAAASAPEPSAAAPVHWTYEGEEGPAGWAELSEDFETCGAGTQQSPIDLPTEVPAATTTAELSDGEVDGTVGDTGHSLQLTGDGADESVVVDGDAYQLVQLHVHTPSEHTVNGVAHDAEVHLVHAAGDELLVVGVFVDEGAPSQTWQDFIDAAAESDEDHALELKTSEILPDELGYYSYTGSLTTPPCTESVRWIVMADPVEMSADQLDALEAAHDGNARPTQAINGRELTGGTLAIDAG